MFQMVEQARQNKTNPMEMFKQITSKYSPEQMNSFYTQAEKMGFSPELLNQIKKDMLKRITNNRKRVLSIFQIGAFFCQRMFSEIEEIVKSIFREFLPLEKNGVR